MAPTGLDTAGTGTGGLVVENTWASHGGRQLLCAHDSAATGTRMEVAVYLPPNAVADETLGGTARDDAGPDSNSSGTFPVLIYLSGLTCTWENVTAKAGAQRYAAEHGMIFVAPDTSPRGEDVADADRYDFGKGAGFYVDATEAPWSAHYKMYSYITEDLPGALAAAFPQADMGRVGITGHSMGGHGALTIALKNPSLFRSVSAFAPIVAPSQVQWGQDAFTGYLGSDTGTWQAHDATELLKTVGWPRDILIDQGAADNFLTDQLRPELFEAACKDKGVNLTLRRQAGYDHSYYFIASFIGDHMAWHAERLK